MTALAQLPRRAAEWLILIAAAWLVVVGPAAAQDYPPRPAGPVYDGAGILSAATVATLDARLRDYNRETGRAIVIATIPSLDGAPLESYATGLFANWGIGGEARDQGLLLLIARDDRKIRIEVGYGLHPYFGGIMSGRVIRDELTPRFKQGDFDGGVIAAVDAITAHLAKSPAEAAAIEEAARAAEQQGTGEGGFPIGALFWLLIVFLFFILPMLSRGGRRRRRSRSPWGNTARDIILWEAGTAIARGILNSDGDGGFGGFGGGGGGGGFGGFGGGMSGGGGASGGW